MAKSSFEQIYGGPKEERDDYEKFRSWVYDNYGMWESQIYPQKYKDHPLYGEYQRLGGAPKPSPEETTSPDPSSMTPERGGFLMPTFEEFIAKFEQKYGHAPAGVTRANYRSFVGPDLFPELYQGKTKVNPYVSPEVKQRETMAGQGWSQTAIDKFFGGGADGLALADELLKPKEKDDKDDSGAFPPYPGEPAPGEKIIWVLDEASGQYYEKVVDDPYYEPSTDKPYNPSELPPGFVREWKKDSAGNWYREAVPGPEPISEYDKEVLKQRREQAEAEAAGREEQARIEREQMAAEAAWRQQQVEAEWRQYLSHLMANPSSWLEHAAAVGKTPVTQGWMPELLPQGLGLQTGQALPGWQPVPTGAPTAGGGWAQPNVQVGAAGLPQLTRPSQQYFARMNPSSQQQFYGYKKARTGATAEDTLNQLRSLSAPAGRQQGLYYQR